MDKNKKNLQLRANYWKAYRDQIANEAKTYKKISEESEFVAAIEKQIDKIDPSIVYENRPENSIVQIPFKENNTLERIDHELKNMAEKIDADSIQKILSEFDKDKVKIVPESAKDISNLESLFKDHRFPKNSQRIKEDIINIEAQHNNDKIELRKNRNYITQIISHEINDDHQINLVKNEKSFKHKTRDKKVKIILISVLITLLVLSIIFIGVWIGVS